METSKFYDVEMDVLKDEGSNSESKHSPERPSSPADCAICLEQLKDKSFTNSCFHMFCFHCLESWSKVKPECPLCKQGFFTIIHNIRSMTEYDEYQVPPVETRYSVTPPYPSEIANSYSAHDYPLNRRRFYSYRTTIMPNTYSIPRVRSSNLVIQPYIDNLELETNFSHINPVQPSVSRFNRAEIYLQQLETRPPSTGRYRECSPQFYLGNDVQLNRIKLWLHRELMALSQIGVRFDLHEVQQIIVDMLLLYNINSSIFHNILSQHLGGHTSRFIRELYNFATSPYEMDQYDRECVFLRRRNGSHLSFIVTIGRDESEDVQVIPSPALEEPVRPWIDVNRIHPSSSPHSSSSLRLLSRLASNSRFRCGDVATTSSSANASTSVINLTDSENEDCVIIDDMPVPETIVLDDSEEEVNNPSTSTATQASANLFCDPYLTPHRALDLTTSRSISSQTSDPLPLELPNQLCETSSNSQEPGDTHIHPENNVEPDEKLCHKSKHRRSCSTDSSVLSTCISSDESDRCYKKKRSKRLRRAKTKRAATHRRYSSDEFFSESSTEDAQTESDWEESRKKRKKKSKKSHSSKREKKPSSKKRKKPTERKSKRKKASGAPSVDDSEHKHKPKKEKSKTKQRRPRTPVEAAESPRSTNGKLCSVVKVVHRDLESSMDQPSTSSGYKGCDSRNDFIKVSRRTYFLSDSD